MKCYLDNSATTIMSNVVLEEITNSMMTIYGNPSSAHREGLQAAKKIKQSREIIAQALKVKSKEIIFTSGGTESNNLALIGLAESHKRRGNHLITSTIEHDSVYYAMKHLSKNKGFEISYAEPDVNGVITAEEISKHLREDTILVSVMHVNNEIGSIQDVETIGQRIKQKNQHILFHVDGVQSFMKFPIDLKNIDSMSFSSHKVHGPKGVGGLYLKENTNIIPLLYGGGQENNIRPGTENVVNIIGFGKAVSEISSQIDSNYAKVKELRETFKNQILNEMEDVVVHSKDMSSPYILSLSFLGIRGEVLLHSLEEDEIYVSTGSACSSKKKDSRILNALNLDKNIREGTLRISFSAMNSEDEIIYATKKIIEKVRDLREIFKYKKR